MEPYGRLHELFRCVLNTPASQVEAAVEDGPMLGLLSCGKYFPLRYSSMVLEFAFVSPDDALAVGGASWAYSLEQCEMRFSTVRLDSALEAGFASMLMSGRALQLNLRTCMSQQVVIPQGSTEFQASVVRALSRIARIAVTFQGAHANSRHITQFVNPSKKIDPNGANAGAEDGVRHLLAWSIQLGSKQWPEQSPCSSLAETMSLLRQTVQTYDSNILSTSITEQTFRGNKFAVGIPTSVIPGQPFSSVSSRSGDLLTCLFKNLTTVAERRAARAHIAIIAEIILELKESGATLLE